MIDESPAEENFKQLLRGKLDALLALAEATDCRRVRLLAYFDEHSEPCGNCDNCLHPPAVWDGTDAARKLLSTVFRAEQRSGFSFGSGHIMDILRGKSTEKMAQFGHSQLSTFGIGANFSETQLRGVLRQLIAMGALNVHPPVGPQLAIDVDLGLGDSPTAEQMLVNARAFFQRGNFRDAWALARRSNDATPTLDAALLMRQIEAGWQPQLRADFVSSGHKPMLLIGPEQLAKVNLSAPERYLLSRVDGKRDLESILRIAPVREFEGLVAFDRFVAQRWLKLG
jgi:hypothetical protein